MQTYARFPVTLVKGEGARVFDSEGRGYLDFVSGIAVNTLGHAHPALVKAISEQAKTMLHCSNLYHIPKQIELAEKLTTLSGLDRAFFCNSGAEANEAAIKLARKFYYDQGSSRRTVISATQSFHGRLLSTLAATGQDKVKVGFDPLPPGFLHVPLNDIEALLSVINEQTAAILLEPLQGEGGVNLADMAYLQAVRKLCDEHGILLILDEVQTGIGRCGTMFAFEQASIRPDILTLAKGLGGGVPIGCMLAGETVAASFGPGTHGSTFGGNPLSCAAALAVLETIQKESLLQNVNEQSTGIREGFERFMSQFSFINEARGRGLLLGMACSVPAAPIVAKCMEKGLLVLSAGPDVVRLLPPLNISADEVDEAMGIMEGVLCEVESEIEVER
ncbi:MAG: acetylornithine transaminase [Mariprofundaceae bacterium]|nr:acetylornithine transaminase [Mariprofundaceae bacterium]